MLHRWWMLPTYVTFIYPPIESLQLHVHRTTSLVTQMTCMMLLGASISETELQEPLTLSVFRLSARMHERVCKDTSLMRKPQIMIVTLDPQHRPEQHVTLNVCTLRRQMIQRSLASIRLCGGKPSGVRRTRLVLGWQPNAVFRTKPIPIIRAL